MSHLATFIRAHARRHERFLNDRAIEAAAMRYYDEADVAHEAGNFARERYLRLWGNRTTMEGIA